MEYLIWLEPMFDALMGCSLIMFITCFLGLAVCLVMYYISKSDDDTDSMLSMRSFGKKCAIASGATLFCILLSSPLANVTETYKKVLIYRGVNSALAEKSADTADKFLDVLNQKLDAELSKVR